MWIVRLALRRPYTFVVMSVLIVIMGIASIVRTPKDIFPDIDIPVISVIRTYNGLSAQDFEQRITIYSESRSVRTSTTSSVSNRRRLMASGSSACTFIRA